MARQLARRDSRGWVDWRGAGAEEDVVVVVVVDARRVSWMPGAEGAEWDGVEVVGWLKGGAMRREFDCDGLSVWIVTSLYHAE